MAQTVTAARGAVLMPPPAEAVLSYAAGQTVKAAEALWPAAVIRLGEVAPSVTSYVQRVEVDGRPLFAKVSILGVSLVSVLRGVCGDWESVKAAQAAYAASPGSLLRREVLQLKTLAGPARLRVPKVAGYASGVLFTEPVTGPSLADLILREPHRTADLLGRVVDELATGLRRPGVAARVDRAPIGERSISGTFLRKFNGISGSSYVNQTGHGDVLTAVASRLRKAKIAPAPNQRVIFGDLKPEHAHFPDGPDGPVAFLDPGLQRGRPCADAAKLMSRTVLNLVCCPPTPHDARAVLSGIAAFVAALNARVDEADRDAWLRQLVLLWLMDTTNILSTYLTAPPGLPLSAHGAAVVTRAGAVCQMLEHASATMASRTPARTWWRLCLDDALMAVSA
ncbi:hypothetical protein AS594_39045 [Streptomyces agglomeratus]|uniref:Aminoglycoside phosphotransferase domain-containing protein n=1 Tax=Streptomyces agglomeratus TaxID=285458 RepID=A0A1E5NZ22_9ACTN|nr:hypothetical protein [Streptomyces agglomeratus]OEJ21538.1 hypothetical protein AS594_39045 [Streptomyces agglomeratus]